MASRTHVARPVDSHPEQALDAVANYLCVAGILMMLLGNINFALYQSWLLVRLSVGPKWEKVLTAVFAAVVSSRGRSSSIASRGEIVDM
jgi:hypothetical protein